MSDQTATAQKKRQDSSNTVPESETEAEVNRFPNYPVDRDYDWDEEVPSNVPEFYDDGEVDRAVAQIRLAEENDKMPRIWFTGPTGCGKTTAARRIGQELDAPVFTIQGLNDITKNDILGEPAVDNGTSIWRDKPVVKAMLASQERTSILLFDEVNRAPQEVKGILFPILDGRTRVHSGRGAEVIEANPHNLVMIVTTNEGNLYSTNDLGLAEMRRYGAKFPMTYIGLTHYEEAIDLITERTPVGDTLARFLLTMANETRFLAEDRNSTVSKGVPTSMILEWAKTMSIYEQADVTDEPVMTALDDEILIPFYDRNPDAGEQIRTTISSYLTGAPVDEDNFIQWARGTLSQREYSGGDDLTSRLVDRVCDGNQIDKNDIVSTDTTETESED